MFSRYFGPIHCATSSGSLWARNTLSMGASKSRVIVISCEFGSTPIVVSLFSVFIVLSSVWWSVVHGGQQVVQASVALVPVGAVVGQPRRGLLQRFRLEMAEAHRALPGAGDQPGQLEHLEVLGDGRLRHVEQLGQSGDVGVLPAQLREDRAASPVGQSAEHEIELV